MAKGSEVPPLSLPIKLAARRTRTRKTPATCTHAQTHIHPDTVMSRHMHDSHALCTRRCWTEPAGRVVACPWAADCLPRRTRSTCCHAAPPLALRWSAQVRRAHLHFVRWCTQVDGSVSRLQMAWRGSSACTASNYSSSSNSSSSNDSLPPQRTLRWQRSSLRVPFLILH